MKYENNEIKIIPFHQEINKKEEEKINNNINTIYNKILFIKIFEIYFF